MLERAAKSNGLEASDLSKAGVVLFAFFGDVKLLVSDPHVLKDLYTTNNKLIDKTGQGEMMFKQMLGESFVFSKGDEIWKQKRKAVSHAFYKERLAHMMDMLKT